VVSDPSFPDPIFNSGKHFLEESTRHLPDLLRWLLDSSEGREKMSEVATAGHSRAISSTARASVLVPMLEALGRLTHAEAGI
jgi:hypothetical protein